MIELTAAQAAAAIARGVMSAEEYTGACLDRIAAAEDEVRAFAHLDPGHALAQARALDRRKAEGGRLGPLHGVPVAIKDIFDTADYPTECGSPVLAGRRPNTDSAVVRRLREAGAVIIGKTVTTELAYFHPGKTRNPRDVTRTPGGSSSGSAAAVAAGMLPLALGSQTGGSVIRPAAFCGVVGFKPSYRLLPAVGMKCFSWSLDTVGLFAAGVADVAFAAGALTGRELRVDGRPPATPVGYGRAACKRRGNSEWGHATQPMEISGRFRRPSTTAMISTGSVAGTMGLFFVKASAFTFGSGLAIVPFMHAGVVDGQRRIRPAAAAAIEDTCMVRLLSSAS